MRSYYSLHVDTGAEYIATLIQTLVDSRKRQPPEANRAHLDAGERQKESDHAEPK